MGVQVPPRTPRVGAISPKQAPLEHAAGRLALRPPRRPAAQPPPVREAAMTARPVRPCHPLLRRGRPGRGQPRPGPSGATGQPAGPAGRGLRVRPHRPLRPGRRPGGHRRAGLARRGPADPHRRGRRDGRPPRPGGMVTVPPRPYVLIPAALRRRCGLLAGDPVLLAAPRPGHPGRVLVRGGGSGARALIPFPAREGRRT